MSMTLLLKAAALAAALFLLPLSAVKAQTFQKLDEEYRDAMRRGDFQRAIDARLKQLPMAVAKPQEHCFIYWGLFTTHVNGTGEMEKALKAVDDSIACLNAIPDQSLDMREFRNEAWKYRSIVLRDWKRYDEALAATDEMARLLPSAPSQNAVNRAMVLEAKGDYAAAADFYLRGAEGRSAAYWKRQSVWMKVRQGRLDEAQAELAAVDRANPRTPGNDANMRAWILAEQGKYDAAVADIKADERAAGGNATAYAYMRGYIEAARGNFAEAASAFFQAVVVNHGNATLFTAAYLAKARAGGGELSGASALAKNLNPAKWPDSQLFYAAGLIDRQQFEATAKFGNPRIETSRLCRVSLVAGEVALIAADKATAKTELERAVAICSFDPGAQERSWAKGELVRLNAPSVAAPPATSAGAPVAAGIGGDTCGAATVHWTSVESIATRAGYEDHLARFPNCAFAVLAKARLAALDKGGSPAPERPAAARSCPPGQSLDSDGDCVRAKPRAQAKRAAPRQRQSSDGEGGTKQVLDCSTPAGLLACANREMSKLPKGQ
jgi:tetratricopeptide (TPR) repeat protein